jgi:hypothetical protein
MTTSWKRIAVQQMIFELARRFGSQTEAEVFCRWTHKICFAKYNIDLHVDLTFSPRPYTTAALLDTETRDDCLFLRTCMRDVLDQSVDECTGKDDFAASWPIALRLALHSHRLCSEASSSCTAK